MSNPLTARRNSTAIDSVLLLVSIGVLYWVTPVAIEGDGAVRFEALSRLLSRGDLSRSPYSLIGPLASAPLWWIGRVTNTSEWWCARFNFCVFLLGLAGLYRALTPEIEQRTVVRFLLLLTVASMFPHHIGRYYGEVFTSMLVAVGAALVVIKGSRWGWIVAAIGTANSPAALIGLFLMAGVWTLTRRDPRHLAAVALAAGLIAAEAWLRRGSPFATGYEGIAGARTVLPYSGLPGFSYPFALGLLSILFSFGKGLIFFAPGLLLTRSVRAGSQRRLVLSWIVFVCGLILVYAKWWSWYGGVFWGPRFFLFVSIPAAFVLAVWLSGPKLSPALELLGIVSLAWSVWIGVNGVVYGLYGLEICTANHYALEFLCWYVPEYSVLIHPFIAPKPLAWHESLTLVYFFLVGLYLVIPRCWGFDAGWRASTAVR